MRVYQNQKLLKQTQHRDLAGALKTLKLKKLVGGHAVIITTDKMNKSMHTIVYDYVGNGAGYGWRYTRQTFGESK